MSWWQRVKEAEDENLIPAEEVERSQLSQKMGNTVFFSSVVKQFLTLL